MTLPRPAAVTAAPAVKAGAKARTLLIVEDDAAVRSAYQHVLGTEFHVVAVGNGAEAIAKLRERQFDAVLSDIDMPEMDGMTLLRTLRDRGLEVPVVLVTGWPTLASAQQAVNHGAFRYLTKPLDANMLREVMRAATANAREETRGHESGEHETVDSLEARFERALAGLWMAFQPIVTWQEKRALGYEALLRTDEPSLVRPPDLLGAAEALGRLSELGRTVRNAVARAMVDAPADAKIFVNLHAQDLEDPDLTDSASLLFEHAHRIVLEVTERASLDGIDDLTQRAAQLRKANFALAIDDLGAGYAGLTSLTKLEPDVVKLDMSLVRGIESSLKKQQLVQSINRVCLQLGMVVVVEGVETAEERDMLVELGCDVFQGYLFGRPARGFHKPAF